jgi:hypothetical protein
MFKSCRFDMIAEFFEKLYEATRVNLTQEIEKQGNSVVEMQGNIISSIMNV